MRPGGLGRVRLGPGRFHPSALELLRAGARAQQAPVRCVHRLADHGALPRLSRTGVRRAVSPAHKCRMSPATYRARQSGTMPAQDPDARIWMIWAVILSGAKDLTSPNRPKPGVDRASTST